MDMLLAVHMRRAEAGLECPLYLSRELSAEVIEVDTLPEEIETQGYRGPRKSSSGIHQARDLCRREDSLASYDIEMDANPQALVRVRELHRLFEGRGIHHYGGAGEEAVSKPLDDPGIDAR